MISSYRTPAYIIKNLAPSRVAFPLEQSNRSISFSVEATRGSEHFGSVGYLRMGMMPYMTTHQQDSSQPQQSQDSPHLTGLGLMMEVMDEVVDGGILRIGRLVP